MDGRLSLFLLQYSIVATYFLVVGTCVLTDDQLGDWGRPYPKIQGAGNIFTRYIVGMCMICILATSFLVDLSLKKKFLCVVGILMAYACIYAAIIVALYCFSIYNDTSDLDEKLGRVPHFQVNGTCTWIILLGDSNTRNCMFKMHSILVTMGWMRRIKLPRPCKVDKKGDPMCDWVDRDYYYSKIEEDFDVPAKCLVLSLRFLSSDSRLEYISKNLTSWKPMFNNRWYEIDRHPLPSSPDLVWVSHGLWGASVGNRYCDNDCTTNRVAKLAPLIGAMKKQSINLVWQTNFPIQRHPTISNGCLEKEFRCQVQLAKKMGISLFDVWSLASQGLLDVDRGFHFHTDSHRDGSLAFLAKSIFARLFAIS
jgi:hypothetical protein